MSKKGTDTASSLRIRENQRRSRNRRKELIEELQARIHEYERKGIAATHDMQRAARKVAQENTRLRSLLARHGVSQAQVDSYLQSTDADEESANITVQTATNLFRGQIETATRVLHPMLNIAQESERDHHIDDSHIDIDADAIKHPSRQQNFHEYAATTNLESTHTQTVLGTLLPTSVSRHEEFNDAVNEPICPNTSDCFCPSATTRSASDPPRSGLEITCEAAATIIIEMRGDGDVEAVRASLGCAGRENCNVRNSTVLQVMDED